MWVDKCHVFPRCKSLCIKKTDSSLIMFLHFYGKKAIAKLMEKKI